MEYRLKKGDNESFYVIAEQFYSENHIIVEKREIYTFSVNKKDKWVDLCISSNANGFWNILLLNKHKRVPNVKCFTLCGTIEENEYDHFTIGAYLEEWESHKDGKLYFFANDSKNLKRYENNKGKIKLHIRRIE